MFLLILALNNLKIAGADLFTFHYVSINTVSALLDSLERVYFTFHYVSINTRVMVLQDAGELSLHSTMFLLIHRLDYYFPILANIFTFHYVSINTSSPKIKSRIIILYIPLCFY